MNIVITGSIAYDYLMRFPGAFREHIIADALEHVSLSFLVDKMTKHYGGNAANIAFSMAKLGLSPYLMGTAGQDFTDYRRWLEENGVLTSSVKVIEDVFTASFFGTTDEENNQLAFFSPGAMSHARDFSLADALDAKPDLVVISPNDPDGMHNLTDECRERGIRFVYDPGQQIPRYDGETLRHEMQDAYLLIVNNYEARLIQDKTGLSLDDLRESVDLLVITHGGDGSTIYQNGDITEVSVFEPAEIKDPTGTGDAFRAGFLAGLMRDFPLKLCGEMGALTATYALEQVGTQNHNFTIEEFIERFRKTHDDEGYLQGLME